MGKRFDPLTLDDYMGSEPIEVSNKSGNYSIGGIQTGQMTLFPGGIYPHSRSELYRKTIGDFYEALTSSITGGMWRGTRNSSHTDWGFFPDVVTRNEIIDSKGVCWKEKCALLDFQIHRYLLQQCNHEFMPQDKIYYYIYKYKIRSPKELFDKFSGENLVEKITSALSNETGFLLALPFSVIYNLHNPDIPSIYKSRYDGEKWDNGTVFRGGGIKQMLISPESVLTSVNLNPDKFNIIKTHLPKGIDINGNNISSFPILKIEDKNGNYESWLEQLKKDNAERLVQLSEERATREDYRMREQELEIEDEKLPVDNKKYQDDIPF